MKIKEQTKLKPGEPTKPCGLSPAASKEWDRLVHEMKQAGIVLSPAYRGLLTQASTLSADVAECWRVIERDGRFITNAKTGVVKEHPASLLLTACGNRLVFVLIALGLSPKKAQAEEVVKDDDPLAALLRRRA